MSGQQFKATNLDISRAFDRIAEILEIQGENIFRIRAYQRAAKTIEGMPEECADIYDGGGINALNAIPGIGEDLSLKIEEMLKTGTLKALEELKKKVPAGVVDILSIEGMGPKKTKFVWNKFNVESVNDLKKLARSGKLNKLNGWGDKSVANILHAIELSRKMGGRLPLQEAMSVAEAIVQLLKKSKLCVDVEIAGSLRRMKETIGDIDILVTSRSPEKAMEFFTKMPYVSEVISKGPTKSTVLLKIGIEADLRVLAPEQFGAGLYYFTGSKEHHVEVRTIAVKKGITVSEYGVFKGIKEHKGKLLAAKSEDDVFKAIGLSYIPPELREARGEVEVALRQTGGKHRGLPELVQEKDIKGDLHMHSNFSDGVNTIREMVEAAKRKGHEYVAVTDHSSSMGMVRGIKKENIKDYLKTIEDVRNKVSGIHILAGSEVDIGKDGSLYLSDEYLKQLDWVVASIHLNLKQSAKEMTERYMRAMDNSCVKVIGHPTARVLGRRVSIDFDFLKVAKYAKERGVALEINGSLRLDLNDTHIRQAKEVGVKMVIDSDAHTTNSLSLRFGVGQARRGWCEKADILNTLSWNEFKKYFKG